MSFLFLSSSSSSFFFVIPVFWSSQNAELPCVNGQVPVFRHSIADLARQVGLYCGSTHFPALTYHTC